MEMNCIGIVFGNRCTYLQSLVGWDFISQSMLLYRLVCESELYFEQDSGTRKFNVIILVLIFIAYKNNYISTHSKSMCENNS